MNPSLRYFNSAMRHEVDLEEPSNNRISVAVTTVASTAITTVPLQATRLVVLG